MPRKIEWKVEETPMFPCAWYGGPYWGERHMSNSFIYYHLTREAAVAFCDAARKRQELEEKERSYATDQS